MGAGFTSDHPAWQRTSQGRADSGLEPVAQEGTSIGDRWQDAVESALRIGQAEVQLPAVPTPDWLDRAARLIAPIAAPCFGIVGLVTGNRGRVPMFDAVGVGSSTSHSSFSSGRVHARAMSSRVAIEDLREQVAAARVVELRTVKDRSDWIGPLHELMVADWTATSFGRAFLDQGLGHVLAGVTHLGGSESGGQRLMVLLASGYESDDEIVRTLLSVSLRALNERAVMALGTSGTTKWLTERENQVLELLTDGKSVREIAEELGRSPHTVHDHVKALHRKMNASSRGELVALALGRRSQAAEASSPVVSHAAQEAEPKAVARRIAPVNEPVSPVGR